jgi:hypothetical protein
LLFVETASGTVTTPAGWALVDKIQTTTVTGLWIFKRFATSGSESAAAIAGGSNHLWGVILTFTGVNTDTPIHGISKCSFDIPCHSLQGTQTFLDDCMIVQAAARSADAAGAIASGATNSSLANFTERHDDGTATGNGGGLIIYTGEKATKGIVDPVVSLGTSVSSAVASIALALQAVDQKLGTLARKSRIVNTGM